jgi:tripartite-type tricarboxylate transporter receptor subunit TctC
MKLPRRQFLHLAAGAAALPVVSRLARAQEYPTRPVRWIVGFTAGGTTDILARLMAQWLSERLGQQFIVENRPGAGTNIALQAAVNSRPDGYTLVSVTSSNASNATLYESLPFNLQRDLAPVAVLSKGALVLEVNPSIAIKSVAYLTFDEDKKGSLEPGKLADLAVLTADPLTVDDAGLRDISATMTMVGGKIVHETPNWHD